LLFLALFAQNRNADRNSFWRIFMRLDDLDPSDNVRDLGSGGGGFGGGGGGLGSLLIGLLPLLLGRRLGCGTVAVIVIAGYFVLSSGMLSLGGTGMQTEQAGQSAASGQAACDTQDELFACRVLKSTENTWSELFRGVGQQYEPTTLSFYSRSGQSGCGAAQSAMGPFYCPTDKGVYLDTTFFQQMQQQMKAGGDFAQAYVIAHEVGHHVQNITGVADRVRQLQSRSGQEQGNALQVRMELQADCFAGVWAARNSQRMEPGDIQEGMTAANAIGDDTLMRQAGQRPVESMFTHGTSQQRMEALNRGLQSGQASACDYFKGVI
jgi:uncharacterized protein